MIRDHLGSDFSPTLGWRTPPARRGGLCTLLCVLSCLLLTLGELAAAPRANELGDGQLLRSLSIESEWDAFEHAIAYLETRYLEPALRVREGRLVSRLNAVWETVEYWVVAQKTPPPAKPNL